MLHSDTEIRRVSNHTGFGVFASALIPRGTVTWVKDEFELVVTPERLAAMPAAYTPMVHHFCFRDAQGNFVLCWDFGRYMNHSCDPSTVGLGSICDIARRDIQPGEQLTCEYSLHNLPFEFDCSCGSPLCRGLIRAKDLPSLADTIDAKVKALVPEISRVRQPVFEFLMPADRKRLDRVLSGQDPIPSCIENFMEGQ